MKKIIIGLLLCVMAALLITMAREPKNKPIELIEKPASPDYIYSAVRKVMTQFIQTNGILTFGGTPALFDALETEIREASGAYVSTATYITGTNNFAVDLYVVNRGSYIYLNKVVLAKKNDVALSQSIWRKDSGRRGIIDPLQEKEKKNMTTSIELSRSDKEAILLPEIERQQKGTLRHEPWDSLKNAPIAKTMQAAPIAFYAPKKERDVVITQVKQPKTTPSRDMVITKAPVGTHQTDVPVEREVIITQVP